MHLLRIPFRFLGPAILVLAVIGSYALRNLLLDVWVMFVAGILAYIARRTGYSVAGIVLGEAAFVKSMQFMHYDPLGFLSRPVAALLLVAGAGTIVFNLLTPPRHTTARAID